MCKARNPASEPAYQTRRCTAAALPWGRWFVLFATVLVACEGPPPPRPPRSRLETASARGTEAVPTNVESLTRTAATDESHAACVARERRALTASATEALDELGYDAFADDVCTGIEALHARDARRCDSIASTALRIACVRRVAVLRHEPDACPIVDARVGREPLCLAWAARDARLCELVPLAQRPRCLAVLRDDARLCRDPAELERPRCESLVRRFAEVTQGTRHPRQPATASRVEVRATIDPGTAAAIPFDSVRERGLYLHAEGCRRSVVFSLVSSRPAQVGLPITAQIGISLPTQPTFPLTVTPADGLELELNGLRVETLDARIGASGGIRIEAARLERAGSLRISFDLTLRGSTERVRLEGSAELPIRDVDSLDAQCSAGKSR